jgi:hypothetical protein
VLLLELELELVEMLDLLELLLVLLLELELDVELTELAELELVEMLLALDGELAELAELDDSEEALEDDLELELLLDEVLELELELELFELTELCEDAELLDMLDEEVELKLELDEELELDSSSMLRICSRSPLRGPGNCKEPVWKCNTSGVLTSPVVLVSTRVASQIWLSASDSVSVSAVPTNVAAIVADGMIRPSVATGIRVMVNSRVERPSAGPR